jgi:Ulp1 family protease
MPPKVEDNLENWTAETVRGPQQTNGNDCGVAVCLNMELVSRRK